MICNFRLLAYFWLSAVWYAFVSFILVDRYKFSSLAILERYINILEYKNEQFSTKQQALEFYFIYTGSISEQVSMCGHKVKKQGLWKINGCLEKDLGALAKLFYNYNGQHQKSKDNRKVALEKTKSK